MENIHSSAPIEIVSIDFVHLQRSSDGYGYILVIVEHFTRFARHTQPRTSQPEPQQVSSIMTLHCVLDFLLEYFMTKEANLRTSCFARSRIAVAWCGLEQHPTIHKKMEKPNDLTKHSLPGFEICPKLISHTEKTVCTKWYMSIIVLGMRLWDSHLSSCCLVGRQDFQWMWSLAYSLMFSWTTQPMSRNGSQWWRKHMR